MSQLWDTSGIAPQKNVVMSGETIPAIFWSAVAARGPNVWMRQKDLGIWRSWTWNETAQAVREIGHGLMALTIVAFAGLMLKTFTGAGQVAAQNPFGGHTVEWSAASPAPAHNYDELVTVASPEPQFDVTHEGSQS